MELRGLFMNDATNFVFAIGVEWIYLRTLKHKYFYEGVIWECENAWNNECESIIAL